MVRNFIIFAAFAVAAVNFKIELPLQLVANGFGTSGVLMVACLAAAGAFMTLWMDRLLIAASVLLIYGTIGGGMEYLPQALLGWNLAQMMLTAEIRERILYEDHPAYRWQVMGFPKKKNIHLVFLLFFLAAGGVIAFFKGGILTGSLASQPLLAGIVLGSVGLWLLLKQLTEMVFDAEVEWQEKFSTRITAVFGGYLMFFQASSDLWLLGGVIATLNVLYILRDFIVNPQDVLGKYRYAAIVTLVTFAFGAQTVQLWPQYQALIHVPVMVAIFLSVGAMFLAIGIKNFAVAGADASQSAQVMFFFIGLAYAAGSLVGYNPISVISAVMTMVGSALAFATSEKLQVEFRIKNARRDAIKGAIAMAIGGLATWCFPYHSIPVTTGVWVLTVTVLLLQHGTLLAQMLGVAKGTGGVFRYAMGASAIAGLVQNLAYDSWGSVFYQSATLALIAVNVLDEYFQKHGDKETLYAFLWSSAMAAAAVGLAYVSVGFWVPPGQALALQIAVYVFLLLAAIAAGDGKRSKFALRLTLFCGIAYLYGLLCKQDYASVSPISTASAGFVIGSAAYALQKRKEFPAFSWRKWWKVLGTWWRMAIFVVALATSHWLAYYFPYNTTELISFGTLLGVLALLGEHLPLALYDWGKLPPGSLSLRVPALISGLVMLWYYMAYGQDYYYSVVFSLTLVIDNGGNLVIDGIRSYFRNRENNPPE